MPIRSILLVDDDTDDQYVFKEALHTVDPSVTVDTAMDGIEAVEKLSGIDSLPQLIFLDLNMPRMNGKGFLKEISSSDTLSKIPVIVYSTSSNPTDIAETKALGATDFITKPDSYDKLCAMLSSTLSKSYL